ncbi:50S ribosomal protein L11 methyltransferase [Oricola sp.]|uniref:50S ribosomal protein L11 methyltransferase n=1 Tax=Oricola sp. TaxID=1979950 RepID=UPI003BAD42CE
MSQVRLFLLAGKEAAAATFAAFETEFEDDGYALANLEIDEAEQLHEVSVYVDGETDDVAAVETRMRHLAGPAGNAIAREILPDIDWVAKSLEGLKPIRAGRFLLHGRHDRDAVQAGDIALEIEAGQAFGTGHHGTTAGCLEMFERIAAASPPRNALDLGTGTGVLAIAIARLCRCPVLATDIDPIATVVAQTNARQNGASAYVRFETATGFSHRAFAEEGPFDLVVANILARPLMRMAPQIATHLAPGGSVILSGILESQRWMVLAAFRNAGLYHRRTLQRGEWIAMHLGA